MDDLMFLGLMVLFFGATLALLRLCERLMEDKA